MKNPRFCNIWLTLRFATVAGRRLQILSNLPKTFLKGSRQGTYKTVFKNLKNQMPCITDPSGTIASYRSQASLA
jgi:hypothetical protein